MSLISGSRFSLFVAGLCWLLSRAAGSSARRVHESHAGGLLLFAQGSFFREACSLECSKSSVGWVTSQTTPAAEPNSLSNRSRATRPNRGCPQRSSRSGAGVGEVVQSRISPWTTVIFVDLEAARLAAYTWEHSDDIILPFGA